MKTKRIKRTKRTRTKRTKRSHTKKRVKRRNMRSKGQIGKNKKKTSLARKSTKVKRSRMRYSRKKRSGIKQFGGVSKEDFHVTHFLASGNEGNIYRVTSQGSPIKVYAMKSLNKSRENKGQQIKEANILKELHGTPFVVNLYHTFQKDNGLYMIMDFLSGGELMSAILENLLNPIHHRICAAQIFSALDHMHEKQILHGDIKPENICFKHNGDAYLVDFGHASKVDESGCCRKNKTGTISYLAPEACENVELGFKREYGWAIDCWAMGCVIFAMVEINFPFPGGAEIEKLRGEWRNHTNKSRKAALAGRIIEKKRNLFTLIKQGNPLPFRSSDKETQELIIGLLKKQSTDRLTAKEAKKSSWFSVSPKIDWTKLSYDVNGHKFIDLSADPLNVNNFPQIKRTNNTANYTGEGDHYEDWDWDAPEKIEEMSREQKLQKSRERAEGLEVEQRIRRENISELEKKKDDLLIISQLPEDKLKEWKTEREKKEALIERARALGLRDSATEEECEIAEGISREKKLQKSRERAEGLEVEQRIRRENISELEKKKDDLLIISQLPEDKLKEWKTKREKKEADLQKEPNTPDKCSKCNTDVSDPANIGDAPLIKQRAAVVSGIEEWWCQHCVQAS